MAELTVNALVLRHADYRDYDRMLTLFSADMGRIDAIARGARRLKSPLINAAQPFCVGEYVLYEAGGRYSVSQCQISEGYYDLRMNYDRLVHGVYYLNLLEAVALPGQANRELFVMALRALAYLCYSELPEALVTLAFEMHLMENQGYLPRMHACLVCGRPVDGDARFHARLGGVVCVDCASDAPEISNAARRILLKAPRLPFDAVDKLDGHPAWPEAARDMRAFIQERIERRPKVEPLLP